MKIKPTKIIGLQVADFDNLVHSGEEIHLHSRMTGSFLPLENAMLSVELDHAQTFVFPLD